jgi:hypothetical protein
MLQFSWVVRQQHCNTTFLKQMTLVIGSVYTLYNHVQDVRPYQSRRVILILMVENQHTAKSLKTQD